MKLYRALGAICCALLFGFGSAAYADSVPGGITTAGGSPQDVIPTALIGYDRATLLPCVVGKVATCVLASISAGASNFSPAQVSVAATATLIVSARPGRLQTTVTNTTTTAIYLGPTSGVTTTTGALLPGVVGASKTLPYSGAVYGIVATGSATVTADEIY